MPAKHKYQVYDLMYDFTVEDSTGKDFTLSDYFASGKSLLLLNFWATWCGYCIQEFPHFETASLLFYDSLRANR